YKIVDASILSADPAGVVTNIATELQLDFDASRIAAWEKAAGRKFINVNHYESDYDENRISRNAWVRTANAARRIYPEKRRPTPPETLRTPRQLIENHFL